MFKTLTRAWNARTPDYLHPRTKENIIWQLKLTAVLFVLLFGWEWFEEYRTQRRLKNLVDVPENRLKAV